MTNKISKKIVLVILDGFGIAPEGRGNAITLAKTPNLTNFVQNYPSLTLQASGPLVGLPWGEMGNSEVGHLTIGSGRIVGQDLARINNSIRSREFYNIPAFLKAFEHCKKYNSALHILGLLSSGNVHSSEEHLYPLLSMAKNAGVQRVFVHIFTDGRDTDEKAALSSLKKLEEKIREIGLGEIATITGRFYAMDRGQHWGQTESTYLALVEGKGKTALSARACVEENYNSQIFDEMIQPTVILGHNKKPVGLVSDSDSVIFTNFRPDRALQLTRAFVDFPKLKDKIRARELQNLFFVSMVQYQPGLKIEVAFASENLKNCLAEIVSNAHFSQFHISESEKYAHITSFFNCGRSEKFPGEEWEIVASPENTRNYVDHPEMSAEELTAKLVKKIEEGRETLYLANYANPDMVGHTGHLQSTVEAVEFLDKCLGKLAEVCARKDAVLLVTADHGNAEYMINVKTGEINKDHTTNPVPLFLVADKYKFSSVKKDLKLASLASQVPSGIICDIAPTILELLGMKKPVEMTGVSLLDILKEQIQA